MKLLKQMGSDRLLKYLREKLPDTSEQGATDPLKRLSSEELSTRTIDISGQKLEVIPLECFQLEPISFKASNNKIHTLPDFFWDLGKTLTTLELSKNRIRAFPIGYLPELKVCFCFTLVL